MKKHFTTAALGMSILAATATHAAINIDGSITSTDVSSQAAIYGKAYHTDPGAITETAGGLQQYVFSDRAMTTQTSTSVDTTPKAESWGSGGPDGLTGNFAVRWEGYVDVPSSGDYTFTGGGDDRVFVFVDGRLIYQDDGKAAYPGDVTLSAGRHAVSWWFREDAGGANYSIGENIANDDYTAATGHPFGSYALEVNVPRTAPVDGALRWEVYDVVDYGTKTMSTLRSNTIRTTGLGNFWWLSSDGPTADGLLLGSATLNTTPAVNDNFGFRAIGQIYLEAGTYAIAGSGDDRLNLLLDLDMDGFDFTEDWYFSDEGSDGRPNSVTVASDGWYDMRVDFYETGGGQRFSLSLGGQNITPDNFQLRSIGAADQWLEFASGLTEVGSAATTGQLGVLDRYELGLAGGQYDIRMRVFDVAGREVTSLGSVFVPEPTSALLLIFTGVALLARRRPRRS